MRFAIGLDPDGVDKYHSVKMVFVTPSRNEVKLFFLDGTEEVLIGPYRWLDCSEEPALCEQPPK